MNNLIQNSKILVVDDIAENCDLIKLILKTQGCKNIYTTNNGRDAIKLIREVKPDLVLLDVIMPGMTGYEVCRELKIDNKIDYFLPIILITSLKEIQNIKEGFTSGADDYIFKPFNNEELIARINASLRTKSLYDQLQKAYNKIDYELDVIANIQKNLLPKKLPRNNKIKIAANFVPCSKAGGDYYDFIYLDDDYLGIIVGDVSGHGTPASVNMAMVKIAVNSLLKNIYSPKEALYQLNDCLSKYFIVDNYVTIFYGILDLKNLNFKYSMAGHIPPLYYNPSNTSVIELNTSIGYPLCLFSENEFEERMIKLLPNSQIMFLTDGIIDAENKNQEHFGLKRFHKVFKKYSSLSPEEIIKNISKEVLEFTGGEALKDDYTLICLELIK